MNQKIYEKNLAAICEWESTWSDILCEKKYELQENIEVETKASKHGDVIFAVKKENKILYLSGKYNPIEGAKHFFYDIKKNAQIYFCIGLADGIYVKELVQLLPKDALLIIYEPSINIFLKTLEEVDITDIIKNEKIGLVINGINKEEFEYIVENTLEVENFTLTYTVILPNYDVLFELEVKEAIDVIKKRVDKIGVTWNTGRYFEDVNEINMIRNLSYLRTEYSMTRLADICPSDVPCIVVAAGPSLNKNIKELKRAKGRACILACDTALKPLLANGIIPDFFLIVDPRKPEKLFEFDKIAEIPLVAPFNVPNKIMKKHTGKKFLYWDGDELIYNAFMEAKNLKKRSVSYEEGLGLLPVGGSVATAAFSLAALLGTKTIILVGQDLAYTDDKTHADGTFSDKMEKVDTSEGNFIEVEGVYGGTVKTIYNLKMYLEWFEEQIKKMKTIQVIDATEGGALIHGSKVQTLKQAIEENCNKEWNVETVLQGVPPILDEEDIQRLNKHLEGVVKSADKTLKKISEGIHLYEKLLKLSERKIQEEQLVKLLKKIKKVNKFLDGDEVALMATGCLQELEYNMRVGMYSYEDVLEDEMREVAQNGIVYLKSQKKMVESLVPILEEEFLCSEEKTEG